MPQEQGYGLFGPTPQAIRQAQVNERLGQAQAIGNLGPGGHGALAGGAFGRAAGALFGQAQDPRLKQAQTLQTIEQEMSQMGLEPGTQQFTKTLGQLMLSRMGPAAAAKGVAMAQQLEMQRAEVEAVRNGPEKQQREALGLARILNRMGYDERDSYLLAGHPEIAKTAIKERLKPEKLASAIEIYERARTDEGFNDWYMAQKKAGGVSVTQTVGGIKAPSGFMINPADPNSVVPIPGGPAASQTPESAAKTTMIEKARGAVAKAKRILAPGNKIDRANVFAMANNVPGTSGRQARKHLLDAVEAKLRAESGAAVPPSEVERAAERLVPSSFDDDATILDKFDRLNAFLEGTINKIDPTGSFTESNTRAVPDGFTDEEWSVLTPEEKAKF